MRLIGREAEREAVELARGYCTEGGAENRPCWACIERARRLMTGCVDQPAPDRGAVAEVEKLRLTLRLAIPSKGMQQRFLARAEEMIAADAMPGGQ